MAFGRVKHNKRKVADALVRSYRGPVNARGYHVKVNVEIQRAIATGRNDVGEFKARACVASKGRYRRSFTAVPSNRCGNWARGETPTGAMAQAMRSLTKNLK